MSTRDPEEKDSKSEPEQTPPPSPPEQQRDDFPDVEYHVEAEEFDARPVIEENEP